MGSVVHFEITVDNVERATKFYEIFDWKIKSADMPGTDYWLVDTGNSEVPVNGALMPRSYSPQPVILTIGVSDLADMIEKVKTSGGKTAGDRQTIPGVGDFIYCLDTEGNKFGMLQALPRQA